MNGSGHPIDDKYASTRTALKELPLGGLLLDRCPSSGNGLIKMVSWKMYQNGEQELHHLTGHRPEAHGFHVSSGDKLWHIRVSDQAAEVPHLCCFQMPPIVVPRGQELQVPV